MSETEGDSEGGLRIADGLTLPLEAVTETVAILARRGSGKSFGTGGPGQRSGADTPPLPDVPPLPPIMAAPASEPHGPELKQRPEAAPEAPAAPRADLSGPQQRILDALAEFEALGIGAPKKAVVAVWSGASSTSSSYGNNLGRLRALGLIDYPAGGAVALTAAGRAAARPAGTSPTRAALLDRWCGHVSGPQAKILCELAAAYPDAVGREGLADRTGASSSSSSYGNNLGALRSLGLIDYPRPGTVAATDLLVPQGLP